MTQIICDKCDNMDTHYTRVFVNGKGERYWCRKCFHETSYIPSKEYDWKTVGFHFEMKFEDLSTPHLQSLLTEVTKVGEKIRNILLHRKIS